MLLCKFQHIKSIFKELKHALEHNRACDETESKEFYATVKESQVRFVGYERLVALLQKERENAKKRIEVVKKAYKTLGAKFLASIRRGISTLIRLSSERIDYKSKLIMRNFSRVDIVNFIRI